MAYIKRDKDNNIIISSGMQSEKTPDFIDDNDNELKQFINNSLDKTGKYTPNERRKFELPFESDTIAMLVDVVRQLKLNGINVGTSGDTIVALYDNAKIKIDDKWKNK